MEGPGGFFNLLTSLGGVDLECLLGFNSFSFWEALRFIDLEAGLYLGSAGAFVK